MLFALNKFRFLIPHLCALVWFIWVSVFFIDAYNKQSNRLADDEPGMLSV